MTADVCPGAVLQMRIKFLSLTIGLLSLGPPTQLAGQPRPIPPWLKLPGSWVRILPDKSSFVDSASITVVRKDTVSAVTLTVLSPLDRVTVSSQVIACSTRHLRTVWTEYRGPGKPVKRETMKGWYAAWDSVRRDSWGWRHYTKICSMAPH